MTQAERFNEGKPQYSLLSLEMLEPCVRGLEYGATKYERNNFKKGFPQSKLVDSLLRHVREILEGRMIDEESGLSHIALIQCNAMFLGNPNNTKDLELPIQQAPEEAASAPVVKHYPTIPYPSEEVPKQFQSTSEAVAAIIDSPPPKLGGQA